MAASLTVKPEKNPTDDAFFCKIKESPSSKAQKLTEGEDVRHRHGQSL